MKPISLRYIDSGHYHLTPAEAKRISIDGKLPEHGYEKKSKPLAGLIETDIPGELSDFGWITRTRLNGEEIWAIHAIWGIKAHKPEPIREYPPIPENATHFQRHYGYEPATVRKWEWSVTFGQWGAFVTFADGAEMYTWPKLH